jgi:hypothetical protein
LQHAPLMHKSPDSLQQLESSSTNRGGLNVASDPGMIWLVAGSDNQVSEKSPGLQVRLHASAARGHNRRRTADAAQLTL